MSEFIIETRNLTKKFGKFVAVRDMNLKITKNKIHGFIGPNGSGKTTTIKMLQEQFILHMELEKLIIIELVPRKDDL